MDKNLFLRGLVVFDEAAVVEQGIIQKLMSTLPFRPQIDAKTSLIFLFVVFQDLCLR
jgi:hypothetical protein